MYLMPNSRKTSTIRSEPYCALLLRPIPAAQISGVRLSVSLPRFLRCVIAMCVIEADFSPRRHAEHKVRDKILPKPSCPPSKVRCGMIAVNGASAGSVIPAKAGIQANWAEQTWIPACAGMTTEGKSCPGNCLLSFSASERNLMNHFVANRLYPICLAAPRSPRNRARRVRHRTPVRSRYFFPPRKYRKRSSSACFCPTCSDRDRARSCDWEIALAAACKNSRGVDALPVPILNVQSFGVGALSAR